MILTLLFDSGEGGVTIGSSGLFQSVRDRLQDFIVGVPN